MGKKRKIHLPEFKTLMRAILSYEDINVLSADLAEHICRFFKVKGCSLMLFDEHEGQLFRVSSYGVSREYLQKGPVFINDKYSAFVTGEPVFVQDFQNDSRVQYPETAAEEGLVSMLSVPIKHRRSPIGLIRIYHSELWELHEEDSDCFCMMGEHMGLVIEYNGLKNFMDAVQGAMETLPQRLLKGH